MRDGVSRGGIPTRGWSKCRSHETGRATSGRETNGLVSSSRCSASGFNPGSIRVVSCAWFVGLDEVEAERLEACFFDSVCFRVLKQWAGSRLTFAEAQVARCSAYASHEEARSERVPRALPESSGVVYRLP